MTNHPKKFAEFITITTFSKFLFNITRRLIYPFAPEFARGLNVELSAITSVIAINQATSLLGPVGASFADKYGYKILMLLSLGMLTIGTFAVGLIPVYSVLVICFFLAGLAKSIFDPSLQAFIGNFVPFERRGQIIGITELAWAGSTLFGIPLAGLVIERFSWQTPFFIISGLSLVCFFIILKIMPKDKKNTIPPETRTPMISNWKTIIKDRKVLGILSFVFFMSLANDNLFVIYGAWLEQSYSLSLAAIGFGTVFIGLSEILGEGCTVFFSDRIGLKKSIIIGVSLCAGAYFLLPVLDIGLSYVLAGLFLVFFTFEFTIVTSMSLSTELVPELRASTMSAFFAVAGIGRVAGAFTGGIIWSNFGLLPICLISGFCTFAALISILIGFYQGKSRVITKF
ncbi:MFS transporter [Desulfobacula sp.]|uniref:MFS transporter n=1 Tax=Desulfobacula sp. TaxID=2593537 RepID=UPI0025C4F14E|nr:MFS transporter [Desulfobacula sp.]MBC2705263.1 MFS transporter [Desulfobacula sp.]